MTLSDKMYICSAGETFDEIARKLWEDEKYAAELLAVNPEQCTVSMFAGGEILYIPEIEIPLSGEIGLPQTAPWKTGE